MLDAADALLTRMSVIRDAVNSWVLRWLIPFLALALAFVSLGGFSEMRAASHDEGRWGTFTATHQECQRRHRECTWIGEFTAEGDRNEPTIQLHDVIYPGDGVERAGDTARAQVMPGTDQLYLKDDTSWIWWIGIDVVCVAYLLWWVIGRRWRKRPAEPTPSD